jgi:hypothetical protein
MYVGMAGWFLFLLPERQHRIEQTRMSKSFSNVKLLLLLLWLIFSADYDEQIWRN